MLAVSHYGLGFTSPLADNIAKNVIGLGIGTVFRFWTYRTWVFTSGSRSRFFGRSASRDGLPSEEQREDRRLLLEQLQPAAVRLRQIAGDGEADARGVAAADGPLEDPRAEVGAGRPGPSSVTSTTAWLPVTRVRSATVPPPCISEFSISAASTWATAPGRADGPQSRACPSGRSPGPRCGRPGATPRAAA